MSRRILHVLTSPWFMEFTAQVFEEVSPGENVFAAVGFDPAELTLPDGARVEGVARDKAGAARLDLLVADSRIAIFHNVSTAVAGALAAAPPSVLRVWSGWGGDYYGSTIDSNARILGPQTRRFANSQVRPTFWVGQYLRSLRVDPLLRAAARAADVFSAPISEDLQVFGRRFPSFRGRYSQLNYVSVEDSIALGPATELGRDILLGNSASLTNNHLEVIDILARLDLEDRSVVAPLSYGDSAYAAEIARVGRQKLGDRFVPLREMLPLEEYNQTLSSCGITIFGSWRQEALGNILRGLWQGSHLVLDRRNPVVGYLRERGVSPLLLDDLLSGGLPGGVASADQRAAYMAFLDGHWSRRAVLENVRSLVRLAD